MFNCFQQDVLRSSIDTQGLQVNVVLIRFMDPDAVSIDSHMPQTICLLLCDIVKSICTMC